MSDDDTRALRQRARHRLIGALALVLAAIIVVPMLIGTEPEAPAPVPQVVQAPIPPLPEPIAPHAGSQPAASGQVDSAPAPASPLPAPTPVPPQAPPTVAPPAPPPQPPRAAENNTQQQRPATPPPAAANTATPPKPPAAGERTDDGAAALALLEGRAQQPAPKPAPAAAAKGNFVLQIVALSSDAEAQNRRSQLAAAGVTNAYVESASSGGKTTYRLRVGPFPTREAAQAAQTRLRALGYDNSFISSK